MSIPAHRRGIRRVFLLIVAVVLVSGALVAVLLARSGVLGPSQPAPDQVSASWHTFHDALGLYPLRLPPGWTAQGGNAGSGSATMSNKYGTVTPMIEGYTFSNPQEGSASASVHIITTAVTTPLEHQVLCSAPQQYTYGHTFHGFPVVNLGATLLFRSGDAYFQVDITIPGIEAPMSSHPILLTPVPTATPLPSAQVTIDQTDVNGILASFEASDTSQCKA